MTCAKKTFAIESRPDFSSRADRIERGSLALQSRFLSIKASGCSRKRSDEPLTRKIERSFWDPIRKVGDAIETPGQSATLAVCFVVLTLFRR